MRGIDLIGRASRSLRSAKLRTLLTSLAIAVGGFTLTITLAGTNGARQYADRLVASNFDPSELFVGRDKEISSSSAPSNKPQEYDETITSFSGGGGRSNLQFKRVTREDINKLSNYPFIELVRENYQINIQYVSREGQKRYTGSAEVYNPAQKPELKTGELPQSGDIEKGSVLLPDVYLESLGFSSPEDALGREITMTLRKPFTQDLATQLLSQTGGDPAVIAQQVQDLTKNDSLSVTLKIIGVTKRAATSFSFGVPPLFVSATDARTMYEFTTKGTPDFDKYLYVYARIKDGNNQSVMADAEKTLEADGFYTQSVKDIQKQILQIVDTLQIVVLVFGVITLIASVFGIINTQYISVLERTREIGLMKALGMRKRDISGLFILEAAWIGLIGGAIGSLVALVAGVLLNPTISDLIGFEKGTYLLVFKPWQMAVLVALLIIIAMLAGLLPARKAAKMDPIEALRTE